MKHFKKLIIVVLTFFIFPFSLIVNGAELTDSNLLVGSVSINDVFVDEIDHENLEGFSSGNIGVIDNHIYYFPSSSQEVFKINFENLDEFIKDYICNGSNHAYEYIDSLKEIYIEGNCFAIPFEFNSSYIYNTNFEVTDLPSECIGYFELFKSYHDPLYRYIVMNKEGKILSSNEREIYYVYSSNLPSWISSSSITPDDFEFLARKNNEWTNVQYQLGYREIEAEIFITKVKADREFKKVGFWSSLLTGGLIKTWKQDYHPAFYIKFYDKETNTELSIDQINWIQFVFHISKGVISSETTTTVTPKNSTSVGFYDKSFTIPLYEEVWQLSKEQVDCIYSGNLIPSIIQGTSGTEYRTLEDYIAYPYITKGDYSFDNIDYDYRFVLNDIYLEDYSIKEGVEIASFCYLYENINYIYDDELPTPPIETFPKIDPGFEDDIWNRIKQFFIKIYLWISELNYKKVIFIVIGSVCGFYFVKAFLKKGSENLVNKISDKIKKKK